jgi:hypothetical protein
MVIGCLPSEYFGRQNKISEGLGQLFVSPTEDFGRQSKYVTQKMYDRSFVQPSKIFVWRDIKLPKPA